jgi:hypothetical protein
MAMSHSSRSADAGLEMTMVTVTRSAQELPDEATLLMWP